MAILLAATVVPQVNAQDTIPPVVNTKTYTLVLDATGTGILLPENVDNGSNDESGPVTLSVTPNVFSCVDQGPQTVTLTATDLAGNSASADVVITVESSLDIISISLNNCVLAGQYALFIPEVTGGSGSYSFFWKGLEPGSLPFVEVLPIPPYLVFSNTSTYETPYFNSLLPEGLYHIRLVVTDGNGCVDTSEMALNQTGAVFDNTAIRYSEACEGETKTYTVNYDPLAIYSWSIENGTILTADLNSSSIAVHWNMGMPQGVLVTTIVKSNLIGDPCTSFIIDTVTINPTPTPLFDSPVTVACVGSDVTYKLSDTYTNYAWVVTGGQLIAGGSTGSDFATVRWGTGPDGRVSVTVQNGFSCASTIYTDVYIYNNTINLTSPAGSDNQSLCINTLLNNITYATTGATGAVFSGLPAGVTGSWAADVVTISGTPSVSGIYNYTVTLTGGCGVITATGTINVIPDNTITLSSPAGSDSQTICINTSLAALTYSTTTATGAVVTGLPSGVTGTWASNVVTISGTPVVSGSFTYTVTLTGGCGLVTATGTINVTPDNTIALSSPVGSDNQTLCINTLLSNITYSTTGATGATVTGLPAGVTGSWASNVVTISGTPTVSGIFNYTVTLTGGCGLVTSTGTINVTPDNTITLTSPVGSDSQSVCINTPLSGITYSTTGATGATVTGLPAGVTGSWAAGVVTISGSPTELGLLSYTITLTGGCGITTATGTISIVSVNTVAITSPAGTDNQTVCMNTLIADITYSTAGASGATVTGLPAGVTGNWAADVVTISGVPAEFGTFNYTVTLTGGCGSITANGTIIVDPTPVLVITNPDPVCPPATFDLTDPAVTAGSSPGATLSYWLDEAATIPYATPAVAIAGIYYIRAENAEGCTDIKSVTASYGTPPAISADITNVLCHGEASGAIDLSLTGGMAPFEFLWSNGAITEDISGLVPGTYTVVVTDAYGCSATDDFDITEPAQPLSATIISQTNVFCFGASTGTAVAEVTGGTAPYTYSWNTIPVQITDTATNLAAGIYILTATDANGCTAVASVTITQPPVGTVVTVTKTDVLCNGEANGTATASAAGGTAPYLYSWNTSPIQTNATASGLAAGTYTITVTDADGCFVTENVTINEPQELLLTVQVTEASCPDVPDGSINLTITGGTAPYTVIWDDGITDEDRPLVRSGTYSVVVTDANGCNAGTTVTLDIIGIDCLEIPDLFTPNDDGKNDVWRLRNIELYPDAELLIFNRWGRRVYQTKNIGANPWDGKQRGRILPTDSYHYILYLNDGSDPITGVITLLR